MTIPQVLFICINFFLILATMNNAAMNPHTCLLMQLSGDWVKKGMFIFRRHCQFSIEAQQSYTLTSRLSKSLTTLGISSLFNFFHSGKGCSGL